MLPDATTQPTGPQPSETAIATAFVRALAARDEREDMRGPDTLAELFLPEETRRPLADPAARAWVLGHKLTPGTYEFMLARTAFFDRIVAEALQDNVPQVVFLGAGYDSRAYRFRHLIRDTRLFELDTGPTQQRKRQLLQQAGIAAPEQLTFVPIDFAADDLKGTLVQAGFAAGQRTVYVWEGVTYYLTAEVVDGMLGFIRENSAPRSSLAFDYAALSRQALDDGSVQKLRDAMRSAYASEPARFGIREGELEGFLAQRGYEIIEHLTPAEMERKYLVRRDGSSAGKVPPLFCLVHAALAG
jgi:methyltransferase (TIGR00027 family)